MISAESSKKNQRNFFPKKFPQKNSPSRIKIIFDNPAKSFSVKVRKCCAQCPSQIFTSLFYGKSQEVFLWAIGNAFLKNPIFSKVLDKVLRAVIRASRSHSFPKLLFSSLFGEVLHTFDGNCRNNAALLSNFKKQFSNMRLATTLGLSN